MTWNEHIKGRQFDVVIRFHFQFYDYLVLVECKDVKRPISSEKVEAFVIKSKDASANKSIMVSASGFQSGAKVVAKKHNIELFTLKEIKCKPNNLVAEMLIPLVQVSPIGFVRTDNDETWYFSRDAERLSDELNNIYIRELDGTVIDLLMTISGGLAPNNLNQINLPPSFPEATEEQQEVKIEFKSKMHFIKKNEVIPVSEFLLAYQLVNVPIPVEDWLTADQKQHLVTNYHYYNELSGAKNLLNIAKVMLGIDTKLESGKFYRQPTLNFFYHCESTDEKSATMFLIESYQRGHLFQCKMRIPLEDTGYYLEVTDLEEIERLKPLYRQAKTAPDMLNYRMEFKNEE